MRVLRFQTAQETPDVRHGRAWFCRGLDNAGNARYSEGSIVQGFDTQRFRYFEGLISPTEYTGYMYTSLSQTIWLINCSTEFSREQFTGNPHSAGLLAAAAAERVIIS